MHLKNGPIVFPKQCSADGRIESVLQPSLTPPPSNPPPPFPASGSDALAADLSSRLETSKPVCRSYWWRGEAPAAPRSHPQNPRNGVTPAPNWFPRHLQVLRAATCPSRRWFTVPLRRGDGLTGTQSHKERPRGHAAYRGTAPWWSNVSPLTRGAPGVGTTAVPTVLMSPNQSQVHGLRNHSPARTHQCKTWHWGTAEGRGQQGELSTLHPAAPHQLLPHAARCWGSGSQ